MKIFLEILSKHLLTKHGDKVSEFCYVFPNRRSGLFFQRFLGKHVDRLMWAPDIKTINELMQDVSKLQIADPLDVQFDLYDIYKSQLPNPDPFDEFYSWGEMMAADFDQLDKYLVEPASIFRNIRDLKEIDEKFGGLEEEQIAFIRQFWKNFHVGDMSREKEVFLRTWELLPRLYEGLNNQLRKDGRGYEGMLYKDVAGLNPVELGKRLRAGHYIFIGFNALTACEKKLFRTMNSMGNASFYWDYDESYLNDRSMEAGRFISQNLKEFPPPENLDIFNNMKQEKQTRIFNLPTDILQAKTVHRIIEDLDEKIEEVHDMAIVACDENLLLPVLVSIPEKIDELNITMGYPFQNTPMYGFLDAVLRLAKNVRRTKAGKVQFYHRDVTGLLNHQYFKTIAGNESTKLEAEMVKENRVYVNPEDFAGEFEKLIFREIDSVNGLINYLDEIFQYILCKLRELEEYRHTELEKEYLYLLLSRLNKLEEIFTGRESFDYQLFIRLFRKIIISQRVPFTGEPLAGLQVMGILETRLMDFKHVVLLSMNEDVMPRASVGSSYIPYSLRFGFELPTREDMDAIYAYYYYRLVQRAERVDLLYNGSTEGVRSGEMSRYLYQAKFSYGTEVINPVLSVKTKERQVPIIDKTPQVMELLYSYRSGNQEGRYLSPSALNNYIECPLRFYFQNLSGIYKGDELLEEVNAIELGHIVHETIAELYNDLKAELNEITAESLHGLMSSGKLDTSLEKQFNRIFFHGNQKRKVEGKNLIIYEIIRQYLLQIIRTDMRVAPFELLELEEKYPSEIRLQVNGGSESIAMGGKIDRIDRLNGATVRIIDYKTGGAELKFSSIRALFDPDQKKRNKEAFQAMLYCWLFLENGKADIVQPGLYLLRQINKESYSPGFRMGEQRSYEDVHNFKDYAAEFEALLQELVEEIFNPVIPFRQTNIVDRCKNCDFNTLCQRT